MGLGKGVGLVSALVGTLPGTLPGFMEQPCFFIQHHIIHNQKVLT